FKKEVTKFNTPKTPVKSKDTSSLISAERSFIELFNRKPSWAYKKYLSRVSILNRMKQAPAITPGDQGNLIASTPFPLQYMIDGWAISPGRDMGYAYGKVTAEGKTENYQRIWRHEKDGWKIAVEILRQ